jgi:DNA repair exonuclease SbcCD nuclease subunit
VSSFIVLGDVHIGARSASTIVMEHQLNYFETVFFPYLKKHGITTILQLGDMFDTRKFSNHVVLYHWKKRFFKYMEDNKIEFITILGNHDIAFKNTVEVNATTLFLSDYKNVKIIAEPTEMEVQGIKFLLLPWICENNREVIEAIVANTSATYCAGHFEFEGFEIHPGQVATEGEDKEKYSHFDTVFSGHYHTKSKKGNIQYVGIPYELTWIDYEDPKGFMLFDVKSQKTSFVRNATPMFVKLHYNDLKQDKEYYKTIDVSLVKNSYVKLLVTNKTDPYQFDKLADLIASLEPIELKIMDEMEDFEDVDIEKEVEVENTTTLIEKFVKQVDTNLDKDKLIASLKSLYVEALNIT